jgi:hypothetical protein
MPQPMNVLRRHVRAIRKIRSARDAIVRVAAGMQAGGVDTSGLTPPLVDIQEALAELEAVKAARAARPASKPVPRPVRKQAKG